MSVFLRRCRAETTSTVWRMRRRHGDISLGLLSSLNERRRRRNGRGQTSLDLSRRHRLQQEALSLRHHTVVHVLVHVTSSASGLATTSHTDSIDYTKRRQRQASLFCVSASEPLLLLVSQLMSLIDHIYYVTSYSGNHNTICLQLFTPRDAFNQVAHDSLPRFINHCTSR